MSSRVADDLIRQGLERFAVGDLAGAARSWLAARARFPGHPQLRAYLAHVESVAPELIAELQAQGADRPGEIEPAAASDAADPWAGGATAPVEVTSRGPALELVTGAREPAGSAPQPLAVGPLVDELRGLMSLDNFTAALEAARRILAQDPQHAEARRAAAHCRERLETMYLSKLGDMRAVPTMRVPPGEVIWLDLDHRAGFVLAQVDGASSFEEIVELSGMERLDTMRILCDLIAKGAIAAGP